MRTVRLLVMAAMVAFAGTNEALAVKVTGVTGGAGLGTVFTLGTPTISTAVENNILSMGTPGPGGSPNSVTIPVTILAKHIPFEINLSVDETGSPTLIAPNRTNYTVNFEITHAVPGSPASAINGFDITAVGAAFPITHALSPPLASPFTIENPQPFMGGTYRFGGLNGGGTGQLLFGDSSTSSIELILTADAMSSPITRTLVMVANPEPGSILLGSLALVPIGIAVRRRRKQQAVAE